MSQAVKRKHRMWQRYLKMRDQERYRACTKQRNKVRWMTINRQKEEEKDISKCSKSYIEMFWRNIRSKLRTRTGDSQPRDLRHERDRQIKEDGLKAEALSDYFGMVFTREPEGDIPSLPRNREWNPPRQFARFCVVCPHPHPHPLIAGGSSSSRGPQTSLSRAILTSSDGGIPRRFQASVEI